MPRQTLTHAHIQWDETHTPSASQFGDIYYSPDGAVGEVNHVFVNGIGAPTIWEDRNHFTLAETGFGTGLNFLITWQKWQSTAPKTARLHYYSIENYPLSKSDLAEALVAFPELSHFSHALLQQWPALEPGYHTLDFDDGRVRLTLMLGEAQAMLSAADFSADAWYLDGFAPAKNPDMWRDAVLAEIARLSHHGTCLATFTAAGFVKRGLQSVGFDVRKSQGYGRKRERITACFLGDADTPAEPHAPVVAIVGGGIAGCHLAFELKKLGARPIIFEAGDALGSEASGNPAALVDLRMTLGDDPSCRFYNLAFWDAVRLYDTLETLYGGLWLDPRGVRNMPTCEDDTLRFQKLAHHYALDHDDLYLDGPDLISPQSGSLRPDRLIELLTQGVDVRLNTAISRSEDGAIYDASGAEILVADHVVFAAGIKACALAETPLVTVLVRGQISLIKALSPSSETLSFGGYLSPVIDGEQVLGATYQREDFDAESWRDIRPEDHEECVQKLRAVRPGANIQIKGGRANLRVSTLDRMPFAGSIGAKKSIMTGFGSRGFQTASLVAKILAAEITGAPQPAERDLAKAINPARYL